METGAASALNGRVNLRVFMQKAAIFGAAGAIGPWIAAELQRRKLPFRVVGRSRGKLEAG